MRYGKIIDGTAEGELEEEERNCSLKLRFSNRKKAMSARWEGAPYVYKCPVCGDWHLTKQKQDNGGQEAT